MEIIEISKDAIDRINEFHRDISNGAGDNLHSFHIIGTVLTHDYDPKRSDINSIVVLKQMSLKFLKYLASIGKRYRKKSISAPLIMTPEYIEKSLDVFPVEFLNFKLIHKTLEGDDILKDLEIKTKHLRLQTERELKSKLIWLRQGYISSLGDRKLLTEGLSESITGYMPLLRAIVHLFGETPPVKRRDVLVRLENLTGVKTGIFEKMLLLRKKEISLSERELESAFEEYYHATEELTKKVDEIRI